MQPFVYRRAAGIDAAAAAADGSGLPPNRAPSQFIAGGTTMSDLMRLGVLHPEVLVDINPLQVRLAGIEAGADGLRLGALVRMSEAEIHPLIRKEYPVIADSLRLAASQQIRNMASLAGNVLQRTRCLYFRDTAFACNKRDPGSGCAAREGVNRQHAVLGTSDHCIATYPGDLAQALVALDAQVETRGPKGERRIPFAELHRAPDDRPEVETVLEPGELITFIAVPAGAWTRRSRYVKVRDRDSYAFALASAAVALDLEGDRVREARIALGGVATRPWRAREAEAELAGRPLDEQAAQQAAEAAFAQARPFSHNGFKVPLGKATLVRALLETRDMRV